MQEPEYDLGVIRTHTGRAVDLVHPSPSMFFVDDIARGLSMLCRYVGQVSQFYSVAEHSFWVSMQCGDSPQTQLWGLLHDASEAYLGDMSAPVKGLPELAPFRLLERRVSAAILTQFGLPLEAPTIVKKIDQFIRVNEQMELQNVKPAKDAVLIPVALALWPPSVAEQMFLDRFNDLQSQLLPLEKINA